MNTIRKNQMDDCHSFTNSPDTPIEWPVISQRRGCWRLTTIPF
ncbi:MAG TPA: hypothetical protein VF676_01050 [Flavobacterium sp.]